MTATRQTIITQDIRDEAVTLAKLATQAAYTILANLTSGAAVPTAASIADINTLLARSGHLCKTTRITSGPYTALATDEIIYVDADGGAVTVLLPAGVNGTHYKIINCGSASNAVTLTPNGSEKIYGTTSLTIYDAEVFDLHFETTEGWW